MSALTTFERRKNDELDLIYRCEMGDISEEMLPLETRQRAARMRYITSLIFGRKDGGVWKFRSVDQLLKSVKKIYPDVKDQMIKKDIKMVQRLYPMVEKPDWKFREMLLLNSIEQNINDARLKGNLKVVASEHRTMQDIIEKNKELDTGDKTVIINVLNYNPTQIGAKEVKNLDQLIEAQLLEDEKREAEMMDYVDFEVLKNEGTNQEN